MLNVAVTEFTLFLIHVYNRNDFDLKNRDFLGGIKKNLKQIKQYFPGYIMRLYYQAPAHSQFMKDVCVTACSEPNFDLCNVESIPNLGRNITLIIYGDLGFIK